MPTVSLADITPAIALGPLDGRYRKDTADLVDHLSEAALNRNRITVEVEWFIHLAQNSVIDGVRRLTEDEVTGLRDFAENFDAETIATLAAHEAVTVHDVKAVEYTIKEALVDTRRRRSQRTRPLLLHLRGHQQSVLGTGRQGCHR